MIHQSKIQKLNDLLSFNKLMNCFSTSVFTGGCLLILIDFSLKDIPYKCWCKCALTGTLFLEEDVSVQFLKCNSFML